MNLKISEGTKRIWDKVKFTDKYQAMSISYRNNDTLEKWDENIVLNIFEELGYDNVKYDKKDNFFLVEKNSSIKDNTEYYLNISLKYGVLELIGGVDHVEKDIYVPVSPSMIYRFLGLSNEIPKKPSFSSYEELKSLLKDGISIYESIKKEVKNI